MFFTTTTDDHADFERIIALQRLNLSAALDWGQRAKDGFVTLEHTVPKLDAIRGGYKHVVAKSRGEVVGYALVMLRESRAQFPLLGDMFDAVDAYNGDKGLRYCAMGQICVAQEFRGMGVFAAMYQTLREQLSGDFDFIATEVSRENRRSMRAHEKVGFRSINDSEDAPSDWQIVVWDWPRE